MTQMKEELICENLRNLRFFRSLILAILTLRQNWRERESLAWAAERG